MDRKRQSSLKTPKQSKLTGNGTKKVQSFKIFSDDDIGLPTSKSSEQKSLIGNPVKTAKRKGLATIQPTASNDKLLTGLGRSKLNIKDMFMKKGATPSFLKKTESKSTSGEEIASTNKSTKSDDPLRSTLQEKDVHCNCDGSTDDDASSNNESDTEISATNSDVFNAIPSDPITETRPTDNDVSDTLSLDRITETCTTDSDATPLDPMLADEALALMRATSAVTDSYWQDIAEQRREALEEALDENDRLYDELELAQTECEALRRYEKEAAFYRKLYEDLRSETGNQNAE